MTVRVTPKASRARIGAPAGEGDGTSALRVWVTAAPEGGRANAAVLKLLARTWRVPKSSLSIVQGAGDRRKVVEIAGDPDSLLPRLRDWLRRLEP